MIHTKKAKKNSLINSNLLTYGLIILIVAAVVGGGYYWYNRYETKKKLQENIDWINDTSGVELKVYPHDNAIVNLAFSNCEKKRQCQEKLKNATNLSSAEKDAYQVLLDQIEVKELDENAITALDDYKKKQQIYNEELKKNSRLTRIKVKIDPETFQKVKKFFYTEQPKWKNEFFPTVKEEWIKKIDGWFAKFYDLYRNKLLKSRPEKLVKLIKINGEYTNNDNYQRHLDYLRSCSFSPFLGTSGMVTVNDKLFPRAEFLGIKEYLTPKDLENSKKKGKDGDKDGELLGLTIIPEGEKLGSKWYEFVEKDKEGKDKPCFDINNNKHYFAFFMKPTFPIKIKLREEFFFGKQGKGYDFWVTNLDEKGTWNPIDTSVDAVIETIAHELAHAVIESLDWDYIGTDEEGHGPLHTEYNKAIRKMIEDSTEYKEFLAWWKEKW